jgi:hypothetical protein
MKRPVRTVRNSDVRAMVWFERFSRHQEKTNITIHNNGISVYLGKIGIVFAVL